MVDVTIVEICRNGLRRKNVPTCHWWYMYRRRGALTGPFFFLSFLLLCYAIFPGQHSHQYLLIYLPE
jgi:hypothetical protein